MNKIGPQVFALAASALVASSASAQSFQSQPTDPVAAAYVAARTLPETGRIEATAVEFDRVRWDRVVFRKDGRLVHVQLWTKAETYAQLKARLADPEDSLWDLLETSGVQSASGGTAELMICNHGASGVVLSFDRTMAGPSATQIAAIQSDIDLSAAG